MSDASPWIDWEMETTYDLIIWKKRKTQFLDKIDRNVHKFSLNIAISINLNASKPKLDKKNHAIYQPNQNKEYNNTLWGFPKTDKQKALSTHILDLMKRQKSS